jgi:hypothetical protein
MKRSGTCPSCGAHLTFAVGSARAAVCRFCNTLVVRHGQDFEAVGKVADVVPTGSHVALGTAGSYLGQPFQVAGRLQLEWTQGVWDEWYISFADGRWGWLAEAGGRYYLTFGVHAADLPARDALEPGQRLDLAGHGSFVVTDLKSATVVSAAGELPEKVALEGQVHSVDLEGQGGVFATLDYGGDDDDGAPELFLGKQLSLTELGLTEARAAAAVAAEAAAAGGPEGAALRCQNCGAPVTVRAPGQTVRLVCGSCNALLDGQSGAGRVVRVLERHREEPPIPLGSKGKLRGVEQLVIGWMRRGCDVDYIHYTWDELLLYDARSSALTWLSCSEGHWLLATPISAGEVVTWGNDATYQGKTFKRFSAVLSTVERVLGEFSWAVEVGEMAQVDDFTAPPEGLSLERNGAELAWTHCQHLTAAEVAEAFGVARKELPRQVRLGTFQPWFFEAPLRAMKWWMVGGAAAALLLWMGFVARGDRLVLDHVFAADDAPSVEPGAEAETPPLSRLRSYVSEPFELTGTQAVEVRVKSDVDNGWAWLEGALIREDTGDAAFFGLETAYYHGYDDGESWSEGDREATRIFSAPSRGSYVLRADLQWDPGLPYAPSVTVGVRQGGWSGWQLLAVLAVILSPLLLLLHRRSFEKRRWEDSNVIG